MSKQWAQKKSGSNSSLPMQKSSSSQRPFTAPVYDAPAPKQTPSVQAKRRNVDWNRVTVEAQSPAGVQAKLSVGAPGDKYEQEADAMAKKVMTMPAPEKEKPLQREMASEKKEEEVQTKLATEGKSQAGSNLESQLSGTKGGGSALSDEVRSHMEPRFGANFSSVRVHTDSAAVQMNRDLGAQAFTHGSDIYYGGGKSPGKDELTAHELTHVVQQNGGAVQRTPLIQRKGGKKGTEVGREGSASNRGGGNQNEDKGSEIVIGYPPNKGSEDELIDSIYNLAKPYIQQWGQMDKIFEGNTKAKAQEAKSEYLNKDEESFDGLKNHVRAMLRKYKGKTFDNKVDLARQVVQDVKLKLLGMEKVIGVDHQDGQFSGTKDNSKEGRTGKTKTLRIYRTMNAADWNEYTKSQDIGDILKGHGGSLGQAMYYFAKSKSDKKDDVLVEFKFSDTADKLIDYGNIKGGGEGGASQNGKLPGKSEQNDIMKLDAEIFSVNLGRNKSHIIDNLKPQVRLIDRATPPKATPPKDKTAGEAD